LLRSGADPNGRECRPTAYVGYRPIFEARCDRSNGLTPLMSAAKTGKRDALQLLLEFKADRSLKDWAERTALDYATDPDVRKLLLQEP
jgi:hypothetical protein